MNEQDWLRASRPFDMIDFLEKNVANRRRLRLFACACCRRAWSLLQRDAARKIVELAEDFADGKASESELQDENASSDFTDLQDQLVGIAENGSQLSACALNAIHSVRKLVLPTFPTIQIVLGTSSDPSRDFLPTPLFNSTTGRGTGYDEKEICEKTKILRDIFGNPFRPMTFNLAWRTDDTIGIAAKMYEERNFDSMPILADALEDAGCDNPDILNHCREPGIHVRGCWVVDLVLDKS